MATPRHLARGLAMTRAIGDATINSCAAFWRAGKLTVKMRMLRGRYMYFQAGCGLRCRLDCLCLVGDTPNAV